MNKLIATVAVILATGTAYCADTGHTAGGLLDDCEARERVIGRTTPSAPYGVGTTTEIEKAGNCFTYIDTGLRMDTSQPPQWQTTAWALTSPRQPALWTT